MDDNEHSVLASSVGRIQQAADALTTTNAKDQDYPYLDAIEEELDELRLTFGISLEDELKAAPEVGPPASGRMDASHLAGSLDYGRALRLVRNQRRACRDGWRPDEYVFAMKTVDALDYALKENILVAGFGDSEYVLCLYEAGRITVGWLPSNEDMFARDWREKSAQSAMDN